MSNIGGPSGGKSRIRRTSRAQVARQLSEAMRALDSESGYELILSDPLKDDFDHFKQPESRRL